MVGKHMEKMELLLAKENEKQWIRSSLHAVAAVLELHNLIFLNQMLIILIIIFIMWGGDYGKSALI